MPKGSNSDIGGFGLAGSEQKLDLEASALIPGFATISEVQSVADVQQIQDFGTGT